MITKFKLLRHQKRLQKFLKSYPFLIIFIAFILLLAHANPDSETNFSAFTARLPAAYEDLTPKKILQVDADYEKLSQENQIRLNGKIQASPLEGLHVHYRWVLDENVTVIGGKIEGDMDMTTPQDITLDVAVRDSKRPIKVHLEAHSTFNNTRLTSEKTLLLTSE